MFGLQHCSLSEEWQPNSARWVGAERSAADAEGTVDWSVSTAVACQCIPRSSSEARTSIVTATETQWCQLVRLHCMTELLVDGGTWSGSDPKSPSSWPTLTAFLACLISTPPSFCYILFCIYYCMSIVRPLRRPIAAKLCTVISICVNFLMQVQKLGGPPLKFFTPDLWVRFGIWIFGLGFGIWVLKIWDFRVRLGFGICPSLISQDIN